MAKCEHEIRRQTCSLCRPDQVFEAYRYKAKQRNLPFTLSLEEFKKIVQQRCVYCGQWGQPRGIDRRDNSQGYIPSNCQPCCGRCNFAKGKLTHWEFIELLKRGGRYQQELELKRRAAIAA